MCIRDRFQTRVRSRSSRRHPPIQRSVIAFIRGVWMLHSTVPMPAHDRVRGNQQPQAPAPRFGYHGEQGREQGTVCPVQPRATWPPPLQDGELMAKDQDLRGLPRILAPGQPQPRFDPCDQEEHEPQADDR